MFACATGNVDLCVFVCVHVCDWCCGCRVCVCRLPKETQKKEKKEKKKTMAEETHLPLYHPATRYGQEGKSKGQQVKQVSREERKEERKE